MVAYVQAMVLRHVFVQLVLLVVCVNVYYVSIIIWCSLEKRKFVRIQSDDVCILATGSCNQIQCSNGGTCYESSPGSSVLPNCLCKSGYTGKFCETG
jgi:hypothetical protein